MRYHYCPDCGTKLSSKMAGDDGLVPYCEQCQKYWFDSFHSCIIVLVLNDQNEIALLTQPHLSTQFKTFVSGYITPGESAEQAATREIQEELGIQIDSLSYGGTYWFEKRHQLMHGFIAHTQKQEFVLSCEIEDAQWVPFDQALQYFSPNRESTMHVLYRLAQKEGTK